MRESACITARHHPTVKENARGNVGWNEKENERESMYNYTSPKCERERWEGRECQLSLSTLPLRTKCAQIGKSSVTHMNESYHARGT